MKRLFIKLSAIVLVLTVLAASTTLFANAAVGSCINADARIKEAQAAYDAAKAKVNSGSAGFFKYLSKSSDDAEAIAYDLLTSQQNNYNLIITDYDNYYYFMDALNLGAEKDATSLDNFRRSLDFIKLASARLTADGHPAYRINSVLMATSELESNYIFRKSNTCASAFRVYSISGVGYTTSEDVLQKWYDLGKEEYEAQKKSSHAAMYYAMINENCRIVGAGISSVTATLSCGQEYDKNIYCMNMGTIFMRNNTTKDYSIEEYTAKFDEYYKLVTAELNRTKANLDSLKANSGHTVAIDEYVAPTCKSTGLSQGKHCTTCNAVLVPQKVIPVSRRHTDKNGDGICDICLCTIKNCSVEIEVPSTMTINYGSTIVLHSNIKDMPDGAVAEWSFKGKGVEISPSPDGSSCYVRSVGSGTAYITVRAVYDDGSAVQNIDGKEAYATQKIISRDGAWQRLIAFFKRLFGISTVIPFLSK